MQQDSLFDDTHPAGISEGLPEHFVILDCETTGSKAHEHRVIELGLIEVKNGEKIDSWQTFVDPQRSLPPFIQSLTGITPDMLQGAPLFSDIAEELFERLNNKVLVAHNARFDYGFLKQEFARAGLSYNTKPLCSVKLSRILFPQFKRHGLDALIKRFNLAIDSRHRALDDAYMVYLFFTKLNSLFSAEEIAGACHSIQSNPSLPPLLKASQVKNLPAAPGVYYFYNENGALLYVGKSINIKQRVMSHFYQDFRNPTDQAMHSSIAHVEFKRTAGDLGAQLLESQEIKTLKPIHNRRLRKTRTLYELRTFENEQGYLETALQELAQDACLSDAQSSLFRSQRQAQSSLEKIADNFFLCHKLLGLEKSIRKNGPCFRMQLKRCLGACVGKEAPEIYNERLQTALAQYRTHAWPWPSAVLIRESHAPETNPNSKNIREPVVDYHLINEWRYIAKLTLPEDCYDYGFSPASAHTNFCVPQKDTIENRVRAEHKEEQELLALDLDAYRILVKFLLTPEYRNIYNIEIIPLTQQAYD
jgi:DNA polymerase-3 subunit epsilon